MGNKPSMMSLGPLSNSLSQRVVDVDIDPYIYTSGRSRYIKFDFLALCNRAISLCPGATKIAKYEKKEGGFNRAFLLTTDTGSCVVARLPTRIAGPSRLTTNSEVATMKYTIQEHVAGVKLHEMWPKMNAEQHIDILGLPVLWQFVLLQRAARAAHENPFERGFCVGPHCSPTFWNRNPGELELYGGPSPNCGLWKDLTSYSQGLIETGFSRLPKDDAASSETLLHQGSPALLHPDFHKRNIYISDSNPTILTGLIDWKSRSIEPEFIYATETPDSAALPDPPADNTFETENEPRGSKDPTQEREWKDASICNQTYDVCMKGLVPKLRPARLLDPTLFRLFHYAHTTWRDSVTAARQELFELVARWEELALQGSCVYTFETVQTLKSWLRQAVNTNSDGWVPGDGWDATREAHRAAYEWIRTARGSESRGESMTVVKADRLWPFDAR
ncbi:hypothetical protein BDW62DRAFT_209538 [Aspergillus aurantiobrunneus]